MRDFKFRARHPSSLNMIDFSFKKMWGLPGGTVIIFPDARGLCVPIKDCVIMQYVGDTQDQNGKPLCEGDICEVVIEHFDLTSIVRCTVLYQWCGFYFKCIEKKEFPDVYSVDENDTYKIIGNIYENPELLES